MIRVICVGKLKDDLRKISEDYLKRIKGFAKIEVVEVNEYKSSNVSESLRKEGERVLEKVSGYFIVLDDKGEQLSSEKFSSLVKGGDLAFVIGGHTGLSDEVKSKAKMLLSVSRMTLPHQLTRVILLEQIYRAFTIINKLPYHK